MARRFDEALRPLDLTNGQFSLLMSLNRPDAPSLGSVATLLALDRTTLTANLKPLERRGLVKVTVDKQDKRGRRLTLTTAGRKLLIAAVPIWQKTHAAAEVLLPSKHADTLRRGLAGLVLNSGKYAERGADDAGETFAHDQSCSDNDDAALCPLRIKPRHDRG